jgi:hypothetical protein
METVKEEERKEDGGRVISRQSSKMSDNNRLPPR